MSNQAQAKQANWADEDDYDSEEADQEIGLDTAQTSYKQTSKPTVSEKKEVSDQYCNLNCQPFFHIRIKNKREMVRRL